MLRKTRNSKKLSIVTYEDIFGNTITIDENPSESLMIKEFKINNPSIPVIEILHIFVLPEYRYKGMGSELIRTINAIYEEHAILALVGASEKEYPNLDVKDIPKTISNLLLFYEKNHFISVNNIYGSYSMYHPMLYIANHTGRILLNLIGIQKLRNKEDDI